MLSTCFVRSQLVLFNNKNQAPIKQPTLVVTILDFTFFRQVILRQQDLSNMLLIRLWVFLLFILSAKPA